MYKNEHSFKHFTPYNYLLGCIDTESIAMP